MDLKFIRFKRAHGDDTGPTEGYRCLFSVKLPHRGEVICIALGKRSADNARRLMMDLAGWLQFPHRNEADARNFRPGVFETVTQISTDGFAGYPEAVDLAFGPNVKCGQTIKDYRNADLPGRYAPAELVGTERRCFKNMDEEDKMTICTSHVE